MKWTAEMIDYDGNVGGFAHVEADTEAEARARLAMCGVQHYIGPVQDVCDSMQCAESNACAEGDACAESAARTVRFAGIPGEWTPWKKGEPIPETYGQWVQVVYDYEADGGEPWDDYVFSYSSREWEDEIVGWRYV